MTYNLSSNAFENVKPILEELLDLKIGGVWKQSFADNNKAARLIRQGFEYARLHEEDVGKRFAELKKNIRIRVTNECVIAERKFSALTPVESALEPIRKKVFSGLSTVNEVLTTFLANKHLTELEFPDFKTADTQDYKAFLKVLDSAGYRTSSNFYSFWITKNAEPRKTEEHSD